MFVGSGALAKPIPFVAANASSAARSAADTADWLANWLKLSANSTKSLPLILPSKFVFPFKV